MEPSQLRIEDLSRKRLKRVAEIMKADAIAAAARRREIEECIRLDGLMECLGCHIVIPYSQTLKHKCPKPSKRGYKVEAPL